MAMPRPITTSRARQTARRALDRRLDILREAGPAAAPPRSGWVRAIREAIGMTTAELGERMGTEASTVTRMEGSEAGDRIRLETLRRAADALDCDLVYALVPRQSLEEMVDQRAAKVAGHHIRAVDHSMALEDQRVAPETTSEQVREYADRLRDESGLWRDVSYR
jgi:predicted DNA-binding mobile mystery protein A